MAFKDFLDDYCQRFTIHGSFELRKGEKIHGQVRTKGVPDKPGVYLIFDSQNGKLLYIGKAGTLRKNGTFDKQGLNGRLTNSRGTTSGQKFYEKIMEERQIAALLFCWVVTWFDSVRIIPAKAEADLLQAYFDEHGYLPEKNEKL